MTLMAFLVPICLVGAFLRARLRDGARRRPKQRPARGPTAGDDRGRLQRRGKSLLMANLLRMRHRILIVVCLAFACGAVPASAETGQRSSQVDTLRADFILPTKVEGRYGYLVANIYRRTDVNTGEAVLSAVAGRGSCRLSSGAAACEADLERYRVVRFDSGPGFTTANVILKRGRQRHTLEFTTSTPYVYIPPASQEPTHLCEGGTVTKIYLTGKNANADGVLFGRKVATNKEAAGYAEAEDMEQSLEIEDCP